MPYNYRPPCRRYGVVEGRFCFEGGSHCGKGEGLHVLVTDQAIEIARDFELAARGCLTPVRRPSVARRSEGNGDRQFRLLTLGCSHMAISM